MLFTFPNIRIGLLVGIRGGIPNCDGGDDELNIRLRDVVISSDKKNRGVVVYDFGKRLRDGSFEPVYALNRPPRPLRTVLARLKIEYETRDNRISEYILRILEKYLYMKKRGFVYPGQGNDMLF